MAQLECQCGKNLNILESYEGRRGRCSCGRVFRIHRTSSSDTFIGEYEQRNTTGARLARSNSVPSLRARQELGQFRIVRKLGEGAMGEVWLAKDSRLGRLVAIKVLPADMQCESSRTKRFEREAKLMARLQHANVVALHQFEQHEKIAYLVMEYVDGGSLDSHVDRHGPLDWKAATRTIRDAALGLVAAHELNLIHRDIKPANLLQANDGSVKIGDFGIARASNQQTNLTHQGGVLGTPAYLAPEQWLGHAADVRSDIYALICTYYFLLTGHAPFDAENWATLGYMHRSEAFPNPREHDSEIPLEVWKIIEQGSSKEPGKRQQTAQELVDQLDDFCVAKSQRDSKYRYVWWAGLAVCIVLLSSLIIVVLASKEQTQGTVRIRTTDARIQVLIDGSPVTASRNLNRVSLDAGEHKISIRVDGITLELPNTSVIEINGSSYRIVAELDGEILSSDELNIDGQSISVVDVQLLPFVDDSKQWLINPSCEESMYEGRIPGWLAVSGNWFPQPIGAGGTCFYAGETPKGELYQDVSVSALAELIDAGEIDCELTGKIYTYKTSSDQDTSELIIEFRDEANAEVIDSLSTGERVTYSKWGPTRTTGSIPPETRWIRVRLVARRYGRGTRSNDGKFDDLALKLSKHAR